MFTENHGFREKPNPGGGHAAPTLDPEKLLGSDPEAAEEYLESLGLEVVGFEQYRGAGFPGWKLTVRGALRSVCRNGHAPDPENRTRLVLHRNGDVTVACLGEGCGKDLDLRKVLAADPPDEDDGAEGAPERGGSQVDALLALFEAEGVTLFHTPEHEAQAAVPRGPGRVVIPVGSKTFRMLLGRAYYAAHGRPASPQAITDAVDVLTAEALFEGEEVPVHLRVAGDEHEVEVDLGGDAVRITRDGWRVVSCPHAMFRRTPGMAALPRPERGAHPGEGLALLGRHVRTSLHDLVLIVAFLVQALRPKGPYPLLVLQGEQGTGKSVTTRLLRELVDPHAVPIRAMPRNEHDLVLGAENTWVLALDNLSGVTPAMSDALCRLATGGGFATRRLYEGRAEELFSLSRPVILNGIEALATRPDLGDRALAVELLPIPKGERKPEYALLSAFRRDRAAILGGLFDAVAASIRYGPEVDLGELPRMADFAVAAMAASRVFPAGYPAFTDAFEASRQAAVDEAVASSPVAEAVLALLSRRPGGAWEGTMAGLIEAVRPYLPDPLRPPRDFPRNPQAMSGALKRVEPALRAVGVVREQLPRRGRTGQRAFRLTLRQDEGSPVPSPQVPSDTSDTSASSARADGSDDTDV